MNFTVSRAWAGSTMARAATAVATRNVWVSRRNIEVSLVVCRLRSETIKSTDGRTKTMAMRQWVLSRGRRDEGVAAVYLAASRPFEVRAHQGCSLQQILSRDGIEDLEMFLGLRLSRLARPSLSVLDEATELIGAAHR